MFVKKSHRVRLVCFADFAGTTLLAVFFLLTRANDFVEIRLPTLFAAVLNFFLSLKTSGNPVAANSKKSEPTHIAAGTIFLREIGFVFLQCTNKCTRSSSSRSTNTSREWSLFLSLINQFVKCLRFETNVGDFSEQKKTKREIPTDTRGVFHRACLSSQGEK